MMDLSGEVMLRAPTPADVPLIVNAWVENYARYGCSTDKARGGVRPSTLARCFYFPEQHALAARILKRDTTRVIVSCNPEDHDQIVGYIVFSMPCANEHSNLTPRPVYHYVYIKGLFRKRRLARQLVLASAAVHGQREAWASHWCPFLDKLFDPIAVQYNEFTRR